ncbi:NAD(P)H-dependent oxidoreductase [Chitinivorax sp. B]|uniref:NAD(P)H-dependent oxidoreductase n=1 Tax=Chitinivorax sp. B TaxID=2502235 RepID=UPI0010F6418E|nr:NAD(P)H-dependent oxidoreductase [Chitinivorax sp. B]
MSKRILVLLGHPSSSSFCSALAGTYVEAARAAGHQVKILRLGEMQFDPNLHEGYQQIQALEPDLLDAQAAIEWAEHLVWVYPIWWGSVPAILKGFLDRVFLPGFAFKYQPGKLWPDKLLSGRTAHLIVTLDTPPWYFRWIYRMPGVYQMEKTTLAFCGIQPVKTLQFGPVLNSTPSQREGWSIQVGQLARTV